MNHTQHTLLSVCLSACLCCCQIGGIQYSCTLLSLRICTYHTHIAKKKQIECVKHFFPFVVGCCCVCVFLFMSLYFRFSFSMLLFFGVSLCMSNYSYFNAIFSNAYEWTAQANDKKWHIIYIFAVGSITHDIGCKISTLWGALKSWTVLTIVSHSLTLFLHVSLHILFRRVLTRNKQQQIKIKICTYQANEGCLNCK